MMAGTDTRKTSSLPACAITAAPTKSDKPTKAVSKLTNEYYFAQGTADAIELVGTVAALRNGGVDVPAEFTDPRTFEQRIQVGSDDGHVWYFWGEDWLSLHASRPRTDAERERFIDLQNARSFNSWFSSDRLEICRRVATEMMIMAEQARPDTPLPRAQRRANQKKLATLGAVQFMLTSERRCDMAKVRARLTTVGVIIVQRELV